MQEGACSGGTGRSGRGGLSAPFPFHLPLNDHSPSRMQSPQETSHLALHVAQAVHKTQGSFCASTVALGHAPCEESCILTQRALWLWAAIVPPVENEEHVQVVSTGDVMGARALGSQEPRCPLASFPASI